MPIPEAQLTLYLSGLPAKTRNKGQRFYERLTQRHSSRKHGNHSFDDEIQVLDEGPRSITLEIPSESGELPYDVKLSWTKSRLTGKCDCIAFDDYGYCKHLAVAVYYILEKEDSDQNDGEDDKKDVAIVGIEAAHADPDAAPTPVPGPQTFEMHEKVRHNSSPANIFRSIDYRISYHNITQGELRKVTPSDFIPEEGIWEFCYRQTAKDVYYSRIAYNKDQEFRLYCSCSIEKTLCKHLFAAACHLIISKGSNYFIQFRDYQEQKKKVLADLGLLPDDPEAAGIEFSVDGWGNLQYKLPSWLWPAAHVDTKVANLQEQLGLRVPEPANGQALPSPAKELIPVIVFQTNTKGMPFPFELAVFNSARGKFTKLNINAQERLALLKTNLPRHIYEALSSLTYAQLNAALRANGYYQQLPNAARSLYENDRPYSILKDQYIAALRNLWPWLSDGRQVFCSDEPRVASRAHVSSIQLHQQAVSGGLQVHSRGNFIEMRLQFYEQDSEALLEVDLTPVAGMLLRNENTWYIPADTKTLQLMQQFPAGFVRIPATGRKTVISKLLPSLRSQFKVMVDDSFAVNTLPGAPHTSLHLSEYAGRNLVLTPRFSYEDQVVYYEEEPPHLLQERDDGTVLEIVRDPAIERAFAEFVRAQHPLFESTNTLQAFSIPFSEALHDNWYQNMLALMARDKIPVTGLETLQHFRYSPYQPKVIVTEVLEEGNNIDWFDLLIEISFGDQQVSLKDVRKALMNRQAGVRLTDGSIGLLPADFLREYGSLLKLGNENASGNLRVDKLHFTLIDSLHEAALSKDLRKELEAKKAALRDIETIQTADVPDGICATLRPYQAGGYRWLQLLHTLGWGACLADDMGLGKTLQVITFLQFLKNTEPQSRHLVVCPTSLIFNWQAELDKFAPDLHYHIYYGLDRSWEAIAFAEVSIVITSYGILRSDLAILAGEAWHCVILDESQAIKNPEAQTTKAAQALSARHRICMSGTPLQNNTYDLYAQFQFLNPGLLGSREVFRSEFANPIDKYGDEAARSTLRRMLAPFMLRRTKEQVARDLPDKTEVTLWCEMDSAQRAVYDEYRRYYRDSLLQRIDADGMVNAAIYVLEALLRLRQLCDHPSLIKNDAVTTVESIKLEELRREIRENAGGRKVLVFSQFTEMLALISAALKEDGISYAYLDGKTPAAKRKEAVDRFQTDASVQVFLISLKAGGVGLNLTAAEYVYIVDPWWNPAVEAQAIDRTHRIGQTNKIVAYRMICKDTVEEKVMILQRRKRALAEGLVTEDAGFIKKLTRDDVAFLLG